VNNATGILKTKRASKNNNTRTKNEATTLHLLPWIMRSNSDLKDYLVLYILANLLKIIINNILKIHVDKYHINNKLSTSSTFSSTDSITKLLINLKLQLPTIRRLPKACRHLAVDKLSSIINNCISTKSIFSFEHLLLFSYRAFNVAEQSDKSLNKHIRENLSNFEVPKIRTVSKTRTNLSLAKKVEVKIADFDIKGAVKLLSSDDSLASFNEDVAEEF
jgi:hypothetical protein